MRSIILEIFSRASFSEKLISILFLINRAQHTANYLSMHHKKYRYFFSHAQTKDALSFFTVHHLKLSIMYSFLTDVDLSVISYG